MLEFLPWDVYPALSLDRLIIVADTIRSGRRSAVLDHEPSKGDDSWTLGCVAYRRICYALTQATQRFPWLTVLPEEQNRFTFAVGSIPLKFYKGDPDDPPSRSLAVSFTELGNIQTCFDYGVVPDRNHILRLAIETDSTGDTKNVILVEIDEEGNGTNSFTVPELATSIRSMTPSPIDLGPPSFTPLQSEEEQKDRKEKGTGTEGNGR